MLATEPAWSGGSLGALPRGRFGWLVILALGLTSCSTSPTGPRTSPTRLLPGHVESLVYGPFRNGRQCWVYLPPGYATSDRRYPVLYLNDGEIQFDVKGGIHANRVCEDLIRRGEMAPIIVVAIETGGGHQRFVDYTPWPSFLWAPNGGGDFYLQAVRDTLKPEIDRRYRTLTDPRNTGMAGMSLGGLISVYAAYAYSGTFGRVGAFSPTYGYWGPTDIYEVADSLGRADTFVRWYQDTGYPDDNRIDGMIGLALGQGFKPGVDFLSVTEEGGEHDPPSWEHRFPDMIRFVFPPDPR